jgi:hypothetical protein
MLSEAGDGFGSGPPACRLRILGYRIRGRVSPDDALQGESAMADPIPGEHGAREIVALFRSRAEFDLAVSLLLSAGFGRADLSVLSSHESLDAAGRPGKPRDEALTALLGELSYAFPLTTAGLIAIVGGPIAGPIAAVVAAGVGGAAVKEYLDEITATPHTDDFARALEAGGVILWVSVGTASRLDSATEDKARTLLARAGGTNIHVVERAREA